MNQKSTVIFISIILKYLCDFLFIIQQFFLLKIKSDWKKIKMNLTNEAIQTCEFLFQTLKIKLNEQNNLIAILKSTVTKQKRQTLWKEKKEE